MRGLIMEGGSMRGMFTCGILDVWLEEGITFDGAAGVSAGAAFGCNYKSRQIGRAIRYNKKYCKDKRFASFSSWRKTGDFFGVDFCYHELPEKLDPFDSDSFRENPMDFYVVCTNVETGRAIYHKCIDGRGNDIEWIRGSASIPLISNVVKIGKYKVLDGGIGDSIPLRFMEHKGYDRNVVILTRPEGYVKKKNKMMPAAKKMLKAYPKMIKAMSERHIHYNRTLEYIAEKEKRGEVLVLRPPMAIPVKSFGNGPEDLERAYQMGRRTGKAYLKSVKEFLEEKQTDSVCTKC